MTYSFKETDFKNSISTAVEKIKPVMGDISQSLLESHIALDSIKLDQWERLLDKYQLDLNEFERDILLYISFYQHRKLDSLSIKVFIILCM